MKNFLFLTFLLAIHFSGIAESVPLQTLITKADDPVPDENSFRLTKNFKVIHYDIDLTPSIFKETSGIKQFEFKGKVNIHLQPLKKNLQKITLHKRFINLQSKNLIEIDPEIGAPPKPIKIFDEVPHNETTDLFSLMLETALNSSRTYNLTLDYTGEMKDDMKGFYKSDYVDETGKTIYIGSTQFQPNHARRAFPCFDEPFYKATFDITINHEKEFETVVSNTQEISKSVPDADGRVKRVFARTPRMSTYLVAFLVSNFKGPVTTDNKFGVLARAEYEKQTNYSFVDGQRLLGALGKFLGKTYEELTNEKMHMAAIPDFSAGAMENWGLLTYRERGLLYDPKETTDTSQQSIGLVIAHEQAHMWFGDYVTCDWWDHTWLNEGFATYFQYFISHEINDDWELDKQFVLDQMHSVMVMDSTADTHPMSDKNINTPADIGKMFGSISYNKAASIIRMFRYSMGNLKFQRALQAYLKQRAFQESRPAFLFNAFIDELNPSNKEEVEQFLKSWTEQVGYPVVTVKVVDDGKNVEVSQERYLLEEVTENKDLKYIVPFTFTTEREPNFDSPKPSQIHFFKEPTKYNLLSEGGYLNKSQYIVANIEQMGYYRVMYEEQNWHNIHHALESLNFGGIKEINRAQIVDDLFNFGRSGHLEYKLVMDVLNYLKNETHYLPWSAAFNGFSFIEAKLGKDNKELTERIHMVLPKVYDSLEFTPRNDEKRLDTYNRVKVLNWACKYEFQNCNNQAKEIFEKFVNDKEKNVIDKNIRSVVYCSAVRNDDSGKNYKILQERFINTKIPTEKTLVLSTLGCVKTEEHIKTHYEFILSKNVRKQDKSAGLNSLIFENPENAEHVFKLIEKDHNALGNALGGGHDDVAAVISTITGRFTTNEQKNLIEEFLKKPDLGDSVKNKIKKSMEKIDKNMEWLDTHKEKLKKALSGVAANTFSVVLLVFTTVFYYVTNY